MARPPKAGTGACTAAVRYWKLRWPSMLTCSVYSVIPLSAPASEDSCAS